MSSAYSGPILELNDVSFGYPGSGTIVRGLSCAVREREIIGLLGANGSGKSTMLKLAAGMLRPAAGTISLWNKPLASYRNRDRAKLLCYFPQHLDVTVPFTVREIVGMGLYPYDIPPAMTVDEPSTVFQPTVSPRNNQPQRMPNRGIRKVTVSVEVAPTSATRRKYSR